MPAPPRVAIQVGLPFNRARLVATGAVVDVDAGTVPSFNPNR